MESIKFKDAEIKASCNLSSKKKSQKDRLNLSCQYIGVLPNGLPARLATIKQRLRSNWAGVYIMTEEEHLLAGTGHKKYTHSFSDSSEAELFNGNPIQTIHEYAYPIVINTHTIGYLLIEKTSLEDRLSTDLISAYADVITNILESEYRKQLADKYLKKYQIEESRIKKITRHYSVIMGMAAHDLISPLNAIQGYIDMLENPTPDESIDDFKEYFSKMSSGLNEITAMLKQLKDVRYFKDENKSVEPKLTNVNWILQDVTNLYLAKANIKSIGLTYDGPEQPVFIHADVTKLKRSIINLVSNAIKFSKPDGFVRMELEVIDSYAFIRVIDNGIGIREDLQEEIFRPFIQLIDHEDADPDSVGLGLYITSTFVKQMGGQLSLKSVLGEGSCFTIKMKQVEINQ
ncbi:MAG: HAMP domain-containing sensor histidine kinase [Balneolales bacterium]